MAFDPIPTPVRGSKRMALSVIDPQVSIAVRTTGKPGPDGRRAWQILLFVNRAALDRLRVEPDGALDVAIGSGPDRGKARLTAAAPGAGFRVRAMKHRTDARVCVPITRVAALRKALLGTVRRDLRIATGPGGAPFGVFDLPAEALAPIDPARSLMG